MLVVHSNQPLNSTSDLFPELVFEVLSEFLLTWEIYFVSILGGLVCHRLRQVQLVFVQENMQWPVLNAQGHARNASIALHAW